MVQDGPAGRVAGVSPKKGIHEPQLVELPPVAPFSALISMGWRVFRAVLPLHIFIINVFSGLLMFGQIWPPNGPKWPPPWSKMVHGFIL